MNIGHNASFNLSALVWLERFALIMFLNKKAMENTIEFVETEIRVWNYIGLR